MRVLVILLCAALGCSHRPVRDLGVTLIVEPSCILNPVQLHGCSTDSPPTCQTVTIDYKSGCERIEIAQ